MKKGRKGKKKKKKEKGKRKKERKKQRKKLSRTRGREWGIAQERFVESYIYLGTSVDFPGFTERPAPGGRGLFLLILGAYLRKRKRRQIRDTVTAR